MGAVSTSRFQTTFWSLVLAAAAQPSTQAREALAKLCQTYWHPVRKEKQFEKMSAFLTCAPEGARYQGLAAELGMSAGTLRVAVHRIRTKYRNILRVEIAETVPTPEEIDQEIRFLLSTLSG